MLEDRAGLADSGGEVFPVPPGLLRFTFGVENRSVPMLEALALLDAQVGLLVHASTDGSQQLTENDLQYKQNRRKFLRLMATLKLKDPIPYENLGVWNGLWKRLPTWATPTSVNDLVADWAVPAAVAQQ